MLLRLLIVVVLEVLAVVFAVVVVVQCLWWWCECAGQACAAGWPCQRLDGCRIWAACPMRSYNVRQKSVAPWPQA